MAYNKDTDYMDLIKKAVAKGDTAAAAEAEAARNEKIDAEGLNVAKTNDFSSLLQPDRLGVGTLPFAQTGANINNDYSSYINNAFISAKQAQNAATNSAIAGYKAQIPEIQKAYGQQKANTYATSRISAIGNNEKLAAQGLAGNLYANPISGTSETSRISQDNNLRGSINTLSSEEQSAIDKIKTAIAQAKATGQQNVSQLSSDYALKLADAKKYDNETAYNRAQTAAQTAADQLKDTYSKQLTNAETLAQYGDFSGYKALGYTDAQITSMEGTYIKSQQAAAAKAAASASSRGSTKAAKAYSMGSYANMLVAKYVNEPAALEKALRDSLSAGLISENDYQAGLVYAGGQGDTSNSQRNLALDTNIGGVLRTSGNEAAVAYINRLLQQGTITEDEAVNYFNKYGLN